MKDGSFFLILEVMCEELTLASLAQKRLESHIKELTLMLVSLNSSFVYYIFIFRHTLWRITVKLYSDNVKLF